MDGEGEVEVEVPRGCGGERVLDGTPLCLNRSRWELERIAAAAAIVCACV